MKHREAARQSRVRFSACGPASGARHGIDTSTQPMANRLVTAPGFGSDGALTLRPPEQQRSDMPIRKRPSKR